MMHKKDHKNIMQRHTKISNTNRQEGLAIVVALVFLLVTTLIGISALQANFVNEKMAFANMQRARALEAAEIALLEGEDFVENYYSQIIAGVIAGSGVSRTVTNNSKTCSVVVNGQGGVCSSKEQSDNPQDNFDNWIDVVGNNNSVNAWTSNGRHRSVREAVVNKFELNTAPKYIVEFMGYIVDSTGATGCTVGSGFEAEVDAWPYCSLDNLQFRITALATTGNYDETRVMLQSTYVVDD